MYLMYRGYIFPIGKSKWNQDGIRHGILARLEKGHLPLCLM